MEQPIGGIVKKCLLSTRAEHHPIGFSAASTGACFGLSICRTPQHPYPWVSAVSRGGAAEEAGLAPGDYLLHINQTPLLGLGVHLVANAMRDESQHIEIFYWRPEGIGASLASIPSIQHFMPKMDELLAAILCPICFEVPDIAIQCTNGHLLCLTCRRRSFKCPICRTPLRTPSGVPLGGRNLLAEQLRSAFFESSTIQRVERASKSKEASLPMQKRAQTVIRRFSSSLFHQSIDAKTLRNQLSALRKNMRVNTL